MDIQTITTLVTIVVSLILGEVSKKLKIVANNKIPLQNLAIGLIIALIEYLITKDFQVAIAVSGLTAGGTYDFLKNYMLLKGENKNG